MVEAGLCRRRRAAAVASAIRDADPMQAVIAHPHVRRDRRAVAGARRFNTWLVALFALTALVLAAVGTYGVMAYAVTSRTRELGVRAALGASPRDLMRMVLGQGAVAHAAGHIDRSRRRIPDDALHGLAALRRGAARSADVRARGRA